MWWRFETAARNNAKLKAAGKEAGWLWAMCALYATEQHTDGFVPQGEFDEIVRQWGASEFVGRLTEALVPGSGPLLDKADGGVVVHDYLDYNPTSEETKRLSSLRSRAGRKGLESRYSSKCKNHLQLANDSSKCPVDGWVDPSSDPSSGSTPEELAEDARKRGVNDAAIQFVAKMAGAIEHAYHLTHQMASCVPQDKLWSVASHLRDVVIADGYKTARKAEDAILGICGLYFADPDPFVADAKHPLTMLLGERVNRYRRPLAQAKAVAGG